MRDGKEVMYSHYGWRYEGEWKNGWKHGRGKLFQFEWGV